MNKQWITVCHVQDLVANSGVCALVEQDQVAIFKLASANDERLFAISNWDPIGQANVLYRGLLGSVQDTLFVASPLYKQRFCLASGQCLDNDSARVQVYATRIVDQQVQLQLAG
jgi:nitrite reductase (NADH) small subunit